jgi:hypothetical protein
MTSDLQRQAIALLAHIWSKSPDVRLGQLLAHLGFLGEVLRDRRMAVIDDDELMSVMQHHLAELNAREHSERNPLAGDARARVSA